MPHLELVTPDETISLDEVLYSDTGLNVTSGVTGLGFPDVEHQYTTGAGDGSRLRYSRVLERDIDLPIYAKGEDREALKALVSRLAIAFMYECKLRFVDDNDEEWQVTIHRTGGGNWVYGEDTSGVRDLVTVFTVRASDPFWYKTEQEGGSLDDPGGGEVALTNTGDAKAFPVITLDGPALGLDAYAPNDDGFAWGGVIDEGEQVVFDFAKHTVIDDQGRSRYGEVAPGSVWWGMPPGEHDYIVATDNNSDELLEALGTDKHNLITNPTMKSGTDWTYHPWRLFGKRTTWPNIDVSYPERVYGKNQQIRFYHKYAGVRVEMYQDVPNLVIGETYTFGCIVNWRHNKRTRIHQAPFIQVGPASDGLRKYAKRYKGMNVFVGPGYKAKWQALQITFTATRETERFWVCMATSKNSNYSQMLNYTNVFVTEGTSGAFFNGDTKDVPGKKLYSWDGSRYYSSSTMTVPSGAVDPLQTNVNVLWTPRKWAMV